MRRSSDVEHGETGEIELEPMIGKSKDVDQLISLADTTTRNGFVRKVFGIVGVQLLATSFIAGLVVRHGHQWVHSSPSTVLTIVTFCCFLSLMVGVVFACCPEMMRQSPRNYGLMAIFTVAESVLVGFACLQYTMGSVLVCFCLTGLVVLGLMAYAMQSKQDFTGGGPYLFCFLLVLFGTGIVLSLGASLGLAGTAAFSTIQILYAGMSALVFSAFIVYDTQMIIGGKHQNEFTVDDYAMAAVSLYLDVIQLFLAILRLIGREDNSGL